MVAYYLGDLWKLLLYPLVIHLQVTNKDKFYLRINIMKSTILSLTITLCLPALVFADPYVVGPDGNPDTNFVVTHIISALDGQTPRLEAVRNPAYGTGVVAAGVDNGILKVFRISNGIVTSIGIKSGYPNVSDVRSIRFDWTGQFSSELFISVQYDSDNNNETNRTNLIRLSGMNQFTVESALGDSSDYLCCIFDFVIDKSSNANIILVDGHVTGGSSLYIADTSFNMTKISQNSLPIGRTDLDIWGMKTDSTGLYNGRLTMVDWDYNHDQKCVIYQLYNIETEWVWSELNSPVHTNSRQYRDLAFSNGGSFGQQLYVTERYTNAVQAVEPDGSDSEFAKGFYNIESITVSDDSMHMYVSDANGIWHIYKADAVTIGPEFVMREPKNPTDGVYTNENGIDSATLFFNDIIEFNNSDIEITNETGETIPLSVTGSGSSFLIIAFGETLLNDKYTIIVKDSVVSSATGNSIDGDNDGQAGGNYTFTMEHRHRHDSNNDNNIDLADLAQFAADWLWQK